MIMTRVTHFAFVALIIGLALGLCACDELASFLTVDSNQDDPFSSLEMDIGLTVPLTGQHAAPYGFSMQRGFHLARDEINASLDSPVWINFITEDDMSTIDGSVHAVQSLVDAGVPAIVGMPISTHAKQTFPIAQENGVVAFSSLSAAAGLSSIGDYIFRVSLATDKQNPAGVNITHSKLGYERVALIYDDADAYSTSDASELNAALTAIGVDVVTTQTYQTKDIDFSAQLTAIMELNPDALFISSLPAEVVGIMVQGRAIGIQAQYIAPGLSIKEVGLAGDAAEGAITFAGWDAASDNPMNQAFVESYRSEYGIEPDPWAAQSYATLHILHAAIEKAILQSKEFTAPDAMAIRDALAMTSDFDTVLGRFSFDPNGEAVYEPVVLIARDGVLERMGDSAMGQ